MTSARQGTRIQILLAGLLTLAAATTSQVSVSAATIDLRAVVLRSGEAPSPFATPHTALYSHYTDTMKVSVKGPAGSVDTTCVVDVPYPHTGWTQGVVEGFDTTKVGSSLRVCGVLFKTAKQATATYMENAKNIQSHIGMGIEKALAAHIGDRSIAAASSSTYELVFLHGRSVFSMTYGGFSRPMSTSTFLKLGATISSRAR